MEELKRRLLTRQTGYWTDCFPVAVFLSLMLMLAGMVFSGILEHVTGLRTMLQNLGNDAAAQFAEFYLSFAASRRSSSLCLTSSVCGMVSTATKIVLSPAITPNISS